jgi:hypothetical protein
MIQARMSAISHGHEDCEDLDSLRFDSARPCPVQHWRSRISSATTGPPGVPLMPVT